MKNSQIHFTGKNTDASRKRIHRLLSNKPEILIVVSGVLTVFLFWGGPDYHSPRSYKYLWNLGHTFLFFILSYLVLRWQRFRSLDFIKQLLMVIVIFLLLGGLTELLQASFNRESSVDDVIKDLTGSLFAVAFFSASRNHFHRFSLRVIQSVAVVLVFIACWPLMRSLSDEYLAKKQFPVLSDFETPFEVERWMCETGCEIDHEIFISGKSSMKVPLATTKYSGISLKYFPADWRHFNSLQFSLFNPSNEPLVINCKISDKQHLISYKYSDRFNTTFKLEHGWNDLKISLVKIINAPKGRKIDLSDIVSLGIFVVDLPEPGEIYIDNVRLKRYSG